MSAPFFSASSLFNASSSPSSPTQGLQVVNQKFHHGYCITGKQLVTLDRVSVQILAFKGRKLLYTAILRGACLGTVPRDTRFTVHGLLHDLRIFCSSSVSLFSISLIFSAEVLSSSYSSSEN